MKLHIKVSNIILNNFRSLFQFFQKHYHFSAGFVVFFYYFEN